MRRGRAEQALLHSFQKKSREFLATIPGDAMGSFRLGSALGFEIRIAYSWFLIFFIIYCTLSYGVFPAQYPEMTAPSYALMGFFASLLFFVSLLLHELGHSLVARSRGIEVGSITLFFFGGVAQAKEDFSNPGDEFRVAIAGPLASLILCVLFWLSWSGGVQGGGATVWVGVVGYLAGINLAIAVFNLLPGFPMDGGRVLRAVIWKATGDVMRATRLASSLGQGVGYLVMAFGFLQMIGAPLGGVWLVLVGWFIRNVAAHNYESQKMRYLLQGVSAQQVMRSTQGGGVGPRTDLQSLLDSLSLRGEMLSAFLVIEEGVLQGILPLERIREVPRNQWRQRKVRDVMVPLESSIVVEPDDEICAVMRRMDEAKARVVVVARDGYPTGIFTSQDLSRTASRMDVLLRSKAASAALP